MHSRNFPSLLFCLPEICVAKAIRTSNPRPFPQWDDSGGMGQNLGPSKLLTHQHPVHLNIYIYNYIYIRV